MSLFWRLHALPSSLLSLSFKKRLALAAGCVLITLTSSLLLPGGSSALLCVPLALTAWLFRRRGWLLCGSGMLLVQWTFYGFRADSVFLALPITCSLLIEALAFLFVGQLIYSLRTLLARAKVDSQQMTLAYEKLEQLQQSRDQFVANATHELRTSLTSVSGYLDLLDEHGIMLDESTRTLFFRYAKEGADELMTSVNTILETMREHAKERPIQLEPVSVAQVVRETIDHLSPQLVKAHPTRIDIDEQVLVYADRQHLRQVLRNLLSNAFKYTPTRSPVVVSVQEVALDYAPCSLRQICISIQDRGPGIPLSEQTRIFQQFARLERDMAGPIPGSGIGLYTSKQLVEEMGGRIWVESSGVQGEGSTFCFLLPRATAPQAEQDELFFAVSAS